jgi:hypothetical protein
VIEVTVMRMVCHQQGSVGMHVYLCPSSRCMHARAPWISNVAGHPEGIPDIKVMTSC